MFCLDEVFQLQNYVTVHAFIITKIIKKCFVAFWWVTHKVQIVTNLWLTFGYYNLEYVSLD